MASQLDALVGKEIDGYAIEKSLGAGGMARVYLGRDVRLERYVAFKVIQPQARTDPAYTARFVKEARSIAGLNHPNIVNIYRFGEVDGLYYMAMQYIEGADLSTVLKDYISEGKLMPLDDVLRILSQVGSALDYAHAQGVIHRDVKPANVMLDPNGRAYLMDFGLALRQVEGTYGEIFGTPHYIAPEQAISSAGAVAQSDQYSLGVMLYEMLTGALPFDGTTSMEIAMAHMSEPPPNPLEKNPDLSPALVAILDKVLQKEPENRYPSCAALTAELEKAIRAKPTTPRMSMVRVSEQVAAFRAAHPSLSLPKPPADTQQSAAVETPPLPLTDLPVKRPVVKVNTKAQERRTMIGIGLFALVMFGMLGLLVVATIRRNQPVVPTETPGVIVLIVTDTPAPTQEVVSGAGLENQAVATEEPTPSLTITDTPAAVATDIPAGTNTPRPLPTRANPTSAIEDGWTLFILANGNDSLYIVNQSEASVPGMRLNPFQINGQNEVTVNGDQWEKNRLQSGECVRIARNDQVAGPQVNCTLVGTAIQLRQDNRFWMSSYSRFFLSFRDRWSSACTVESVHTTGCTITVPFSADTDG